MCSHHREGCAKSSPEKHCLIFSLLGLLCWTKKCLLFNIMQHSLKIWKRKKSTKNLKKKSQSHNLKITTDNLLAYIPLFFFSAVYVISSPFPHPLVDSYPAKRALYLLTTILCPLTIRLQPFPQVSKYFFLFFLEHQLNSWVWRK